MFRAAAARPSITGRIHRRLHTISHLRRSYSILEPNLDATATASVDELQTPSLTPHCHYVHDENSVLRDCLSDQNMLRSFLHRMKSLRSLYCNENNNDDDNNNNNDGDSADNEMLIDLHLVCKIFDYGDREGKINRLELYRELFGVEQSTPTQEGNWRRIVILWRQKSMGDIARHDEIELLGSPDVEEHIVSDLFWQEAVYKEEIVPMLSKREYGPALARVMKYLEDEFRMKRHRLAQMQ